MSERLRVSVTNAENVHGNTVILPGDEVKHEKRWCRVIEVFPDDEQVKVYKVVAMQQSVETIYADSITGYRPRNYDK